MEVYNLIMNLSLRHLTEADEHALDLLIQDVEASLLDEKFWLPISETSKAHFFDDEWTYFLGAFAEEELVGAAALFFNENEWGESRQTVGVESTSIAEFGRAMVRSNFRGKGIMNIIANELMQVAKEKPVDYMLATVHPNNVPSQKTVKKMGMEKAGFCVKNGCFERDIFLRAL